MDSPERGARILVITERFAPEPNFITADVAQRLAQGAEVTVIAPHPSYPKGRFYPGAKYWRLVRTRENGYIVWRVPFFPNQSLSKGRRALSYLSFAAVAALLAPFVASRADVVWVYHGPFTAGLAALWHKWVLKSRVVITSADLWPESLTGAGVVRPGRLIRVLYRYSRWINSQADEIICSTHGIARRYLDDGVEKAHLHVIPVWVPGTDRILETDEAVEERSIVYAGNLGPAQQLDTLIRAAAILEREGVSATVHLYGTGASEGALHALAQQLGVSNVVFHGSVTAGEAMKRSSAAAVQVVSLRRSPAFRATIPSKLSGVFAAGTPFVYALEGDAADAAEQSGGGVAFDPDDVESLATALQKLLCMSGEERTKLRSTLRGHYQAHFSSKVLLDRYEEIILRRPALTAANVGTPDRRSSFA